MTPAAHVSAAIEILAELSDAPPARRRRDQGLGALASLRRLQGPRGDLGLVFDALRKRASAAFVMGDETPRAVMIGALREARGLSRRGDRGAVLRRGPCVGAALGGGARAPRRRDARRTRRRMCAAIIPNGWPSASTTAFGECGRRGGPGARRARACRSARQYSEGLARGRAAPSRASSSRSRRLCRRSACASRRRPHGRGPALAAEPAYVKGLVEPQDEGSQLAALLCAAEPGEQVLDLCAGGGGKTLALAGQMHNRGQIYAYDDDGRRLTPIYPRLERAGARNVQVRAPRGQRRCARRSRRRAATSC